MLFEFADLKAALDAMLLDSVSSCTCDNTSDLVQADADYCAKITQAEIDKRKAIKIAKIGKVSDLIGGAWSVLEEKKP